jgi:hypothetical protein
VVLDFEAVQSVVPEKRGGPGFTTPEDLGLAVIQSGKVGEDGQVPHNRHEKAVPNEQALVSRSSRDRRDQKRGYQRESREKGGAFHTWKRGKQKGGRRRGGGGGGGMKVGEGRERFLPGREGSKEEGASFFLLLLSLALSPSSSSFHSIPSPSFHAFPPCMSFLPSYILLSFFLPPSFKGLPSPIVSSRVGKVTSITSYRQSSLVVSCPPSPVFVKCVFVASPQ